MNKKNAVKILIFVIILLTPIFNYNYVLFLNNNIFKIFIILGIIALCFYDFQVAILSTILFLIIVIQLNSHIIDSVKSSKPVQIDNYIDFAELSELDTLQFPPVESMRSLGSSYSPLPYSCDNSGSSGNSGNSGSSGEDSDDNNQVSCALNEYASNTDKINQDMFDLFIDEKIKQHDVFLRMFVNEESIAKAQGEIL